MYRRSLLTVHAHPDDEASKGAGTVARYVAAGAHATLVCCTRGEAGDIVNPAMDRPDVRNDLGTVRRRELKRSTEIIGYTEVVELGYRDSGMPDSEHNAHADAFANADHDAAVGRLVSIIRQHRPQVLITYGDDQSGYPHPDHLQVHAISLPAFERAGDSNWYPEAGEPWQPTKLYYSVWSRARMLAVHEKFLEMGLESPFGLEWFERPDQDHRITTRIDIGSHADVRRLALLAHETQVDPSSPFWFGLPPEVANTVHPYDDYILARKWHPDTGVHDYVPGSSPLEDDLFAGI